MELARKIRSEYPEMSQSELAKKYNISKSNVRNVVINKTWREDAG
jgi:Mor family transcriptional regulator